jgi:Glucose / Sorbosone dehydrogenase
MATLSRGLLRAGLELKLSHVKLATQSYLRDQTNRATGAITAYAIAAGLYAAAGIFLIAACLVGTSALFRWVEVKYGLFPAFGAVGALLLVAASICLALAVTSVKRPSPRFPSLALYVGVGSNSNITENGIPAEYERASIWEVDIKSGAHRIFASGLRNPTGLQWEPHSGKLWAIANERDELGPDLVPDYLTSVQDGAFYGWPYSYYGPHVDPRVEPQRPDLVAKAIAPDYALSSHVAPLGLAMYSATDFPPNFRDGAFVGEHGSWDRNPLNGYKVVLVPFKDGKPSGPAEDFVTGFLNADNHARGRPVGLAVDRTGGLLIADDLGNTVWRVSAVATASSAKSTQ